MHHPVHGFAVALQGPPRRAVPRTRDELRAKPALDCGSGQLPPSVIGGEEE